MNFIGKHMMLRAIEKEDLPQLHQWANDPEIQMSQRGWHLPKNFIDQEAWFSSLNCDSANQRFAVETVELGLIGTANLVSID